VAISVEPDDLRAFYERGADAPVAVGDHISGNEVTGFCAGPDGDYILIQGEENLTASPHRALPCEGDPPELERTGPCPVARLSADCLRPAPDVLRTAIDDVLNTRVDGRFVRVLFDEIGARRHHAWLVGGSVRDPLSAGLARPVKDFDATGTIGPGCLNDMMRLRRLAGVGDYTPWFSERSNVWSVTPPGQGSPRLIEYKPLSRLGFRFPVWGGGMDEDVTTRDLTFNALYYDRRHGVLVDPCGDGLAHLETRVMATPYEGNDPLQMAGIIVRSLKFRLRYPDLDIDPMKTWIRDQVPDDLVECMNAADWKDLVMMRRHAVLPELDGRDEMTEAVDFGPKAERLMQEIRARA
jgi:poly(A) polymerase